MVISFDFTLVVLSEHFVVSSIKWATFSTFIGENTQTYIPSVALSDTHLWSCHDAIILLIVRKQQLIILCGVLLVTHRWFLYLVFVFLLGAICTREALRYDILIAEKVNSPLCFHPALLERPSHPNWWSEGIPHDGSLCWCGVVSSGSDCMLMYVSLEMLVPLLS